MTAAAPTAYRTSDPGAIAAWRAAAAARDAYIRCTTRILRDAGLGGFLPVFRPGGAWSTGLFAGLTTVTQAARRAAEPMPLTRIAALLRAVAGDARNCRPAPADLQTATAADLAAEVERLRAKQNQVAGKAHRAQQLADKRRDAYAIAAPAGLPCAHCGQPLKPSPRSLHSSWRHVRKADEAACLENLPHRWTSLYPAEETEPPEMPCTAQTSL